MEQAPETLTAPDVQAPEKRVGAMKKYEIITEWLKANINELGVLTCDAGLYNFILLSNKVWQFADESGTIIAVVTEMGDNYYLLKVNTPNGEPATEPAPANQ